MTLAEAIAALEGRFPVLAKTEFRGDFSLTVERTQIAEVCEFAKKELGFEALNNLCSVDNFGSDPRFEVIYVLYSFEGNCYLRLKVAVSEDDLDVPTVTGVWHAADWYEREVYDLMGIQFAGHPDLRRIMMWDGYPYHPLRKDFPLAGRPSEVPDVAFSKAAPLEGGPFVTTPCPSGGAREREPRSKRIE
jgi:NADH-quinone oxidoreductase subunit C